ncbi:MAG: PilZ domain-containing protein [Candidatus Omnitrophota bacterium]|nr:MAG: PilZ domain-containing protein [Candidatus Omnitrophota bacterium]
MRRPKKERRRYSRYDTEMKIYFHVSYDIKTKIRYRILASKKQKYSSKKYPGISRNISVEGLCFVSKKKLEKEDMLLLEVYAPNVKAPIQMQGQVRWSCKLPQKPKYKKMFYTGVKLIAVNDEVVADSVHYDAEYKIVWSKVLEAVFGDFKAMVKRLKRNKRTPKTN